MGVCVAVFGIDDAADVSADAPMMMFGAGGSGSSSGSFSVSSGTSFCRSTAASSLLSILESRIWTVERVEFRWIWGVVFLFGIGMSRSSAMKTESNYMFYLASFFTQNSKHNTQQ